MELLTLVFRTVRTRSDTTPTYIGRHMVKISLSATNADLVGGR